MGFLASTFTWWNGATLGTKFGLRGKAKMGEDALGNLYYEGGRDTAGNPRRWVIYSGSNDLTGYDIEVIKAVAEKIGRASCRERV